VFEDEEYGQVLSAETTRPLMIVDHDNRLVALAYKRRWDKEINKWVSKGQRGFLPGRSMIANIVELEQEGMEVALAKKKGMILLLDFKNGFSMCFSRVHGGMP